MREDLECGGSPPLPDSGSKLPHSIPWPHAPTHRLTETGVYMVTAGTYQKMPLFSDTPRLRMLHTALLTIADRHGWCLEAWTVLANHYHFVADAPTDAGSLVAFLRELHSRTAVALNKYDDTPGRKVWHNYWETRITHQPAYLARLNYVHQNAVKHGLVAVANQYP